MFVNNISVHYYFHDEVKRGVEFDFVGVIVVAEVFVAVSAVKESVSIHIIKIINTAYIEGIRIRIVSVFFLVAISEPLE